MIVMRAEFVNGLLTERKIYEALRDRPEPLSSGAMAELVGHDDREVCDLLDKMYSGSKLERRAGEPPVYRLPGKPDKTSGVVTATRGKENHEEGNTACGWLPIASSGNH